ncbi:MAG: class I SAM-dependent methyltransferase [Planctomycetota bacterium]
MTPRVEACDDGTSPTVFEGKYLQAGAVGGRLVKGFFAAVEALIARARPRDVLEVGCGAGYSTPRLRAMLPDEVALEASHIDAANVRRARRLAPGVPIVRESVYDLSRADNVADLVVCLEVLEHLDDPPAALTELARVARTGVILSVPREPLWRVLNLARGAYLRDLGNTPGHVQHWSRRSFVGRVATCFAVEAVRCPLPWTIVWARCVEGRET